MKKKQIISLLVIVAILAVLVYLQFRSWQTFDWAKFRRYTSGVSLWHIAAGIGLIYLSYVLRAMRWAIFLKPTAPTSFRRLLAPQFIGFAALGIVWPRWRVCSSLPDCAQGETDLHVAACGVDRGARLRPWRGALLMAGFLILRGGALAHVLLQALRSGIQLAARNAGHKLPLVLAGAAVLALVFFLLRRASGRAAAALRARIHAFKEGFNTIHDFSSFVQLVVVSLCMWLMIAGAYIEVLHSYPQIPVVVAGDPAGVQRIARMNTMKLDDVLLVMGSSMLGSVVQLPGGVGGSQLAIIGVLQSTLFSREPYNITRELAVSCGIMLWLVTFMSVIPAGVLLARFEKISFLRLSEESSQEEEEAEAEAAKAL